jgi:glycosyltransferase involved in cell wall biosynthesis
MTGGRPRVSIVIPTFNSAPFLPDTLESIFAQNYRDFEVILVDDGSTDDTPGIAARYQGRVTYVRQENSGGPARPRNVAIAQARGEFICLFDSDDLMLPDKLALSMRFFDRCPDVGLLFTNFTKFDERGPVPGTHLDHYSNFWKLPKKRIAEKEYRIASTVAFEALFYGNYIGTSSVVMPASVLKSIGPFDEEVTSGGLEDRDMWFRIARHHDIGFLDVVCHRYRVRPGSISRRAISSAEARIKVIGRYVDDGLQGATRRQARAVVAESLRAIGFQHQANGHPRKAREFFSKSLREDPGWAALRGYLAALLDELSPALAAGLRRRFRS